MVSEPNYHWLGAWSALSLNPNEPDIRGKLQWNQHIEAETKWPPMSWWHFQMHFLELNLWISIKISLKFVPHGPINDIPVVVQIMNRSRPGDKPLSGVLVIRSRRNPRSRCAWLTGPEPRSGYARTSFGIDAAAEVTISKCNLWKSWTLKLTSEFSHAYVTILAQCGIPAGFIKTMQVEEMQNCKKYINIL